MYSVQARLVHHVVYFLFGKRYQDEFSLYVGVFFFSILFCVKLIHAVNVNKTQTDVKENAVTSEDITRPRR